MTRQADGTPVWSGPHYALSSRDGTWQYTEGAGTSMFHKRSGSTAGLPDLRSLGLSYAMSSSDPATTVWDDPVKLPSPRKYAAGRDGNLDRITAETDYGVITWWLDPSQGGFPVRVTLEQERKLLNESRTKLKKFGEFWFPETVHFYRHNYKDGKEPCEIVIVRSASFNQPDMPTQITPEDIGIDSCMNVEVRSADMKVEMTGKWDGEQVVPLDSYNERVRSGELEVGPMFRKVIAELRAKQEQRTVSGAEINAVSVGSAVQGSGSAVEQRASSEELVQTPLRIESEWEKYVIRFIRKYTLTVEQQEQAYRVLRDCEERARQHVARNKAEFEEFDKKAAEKIEGRAEEQAERRSQLLAEKDRLMKPIHDIFETQLKPRLDKLPTRAQRAKAEGADKPEPGTAEPTGKPR